MVICIIVVASLIEAFIFLPLHSKHILRPKSKVLDWSPLYNAYGKVLEKLLSYKKTFLLIFTLSVVLFCYWSFENSKFSMFPRLDRSNIKLSGFLPNHYTLEKTDEIVKAFEQELMDRKEQFFIKDISTLVGVGESMAKGEELNPAAFFISLELHEYASSHPFNQFINSIFSFSFVKTDDEPKRNIKSKALIRKLKKELKPLKKKYGLKELEVFTKRFGSFNVDIELRLTSENKALLQESIDQLLDKLKSIEGVETATAEEKETQDQFIFSVNEYGKSLGLQDSDIASMLGSAFNKTTRAKTISSQEIIRAYIEPINAIKNLKNFELSINIGGNRSFVRLSDVATISLKKHSDEIRKIKGKIIDEVYATIDDKKITANEVLDELQPLIDEISQKGVSFDFGGEKESQDKFMSDLKNVLALSLFLIALTLLINFPSFRAVIAILSIIPLSLPGIFIGHFIMDLKLSFPSIIGAVGLIGVVINDGIIMLDFLQKANTFEEFIEKAKQRVRPIFITSITTVLGLSMLIFFPEGQSLFLQPLAVSLGFGLFWGTVMNLFYLPCFYAMFKKFDTPPLDKSALDKSPLDNSATVSSPVRANPI